MTVFHVLQQRPLPVAAGEAVPAAVLPLRDYRGVSASQRSAKDIGSLEALPPEPRGLSPIPQGLRHRYLLRAAARNEKERYRTVTIYTGACSGRSFPPGNLSVIAEIPILLLILY